MNELVVKKLQFPGSTDQYLINAHALEGKRLSEIEALINAVDEKVDEIASFDALRYEGTITAEVSTPGGLTKAANKGDVYKVVLPSGADEKTKDYYVMGVKVEAGDMLICNTDSTAAATSSNYASIATKWDIIQGNVDVEAILKHTHTGTVTLKKSAKTLSHTVTPSESTLTTTFSNGSASVTGTHKHTASGSVTLTPAGTVGSKSITPSGTVALTTPTTAATGDATLTPSGTVNNSSSEFVTGVTVSGDHVHTHTASSGASGTGNVTGSITISKGTGTANYTPEGTVGASTNAITAVEAGTVTLSKHSASSGSAGGHTPTGTVTVSAITTGGTVGSHDHPVSYTTENFYNSVTYTGDSKSMEGVLTFGNASAIKTIGGTSDTSVKTGTTQPTFTGASVTPIATFKGDAVSGHTHSVTVGDHDSFVPSITPTYGSHTHTFNGTGVQLAASHSLKGPSHSHSVTVSANEGFTHDVTAPTATHNHTFSGNKMYVHAAFTGTAASHDHSFTGASGTHTVGVTVDNYTGNFTGTASGTVTPSVSKVLTGVTIGNHSIDTVDSATVTTGNGTQA